MDIDKVEPVGVITLLDASGELQGIVYKDPKSRKNVFYRCEEMALDEIGEVLKSGPRKSVKP